MTVMDEQNFSREVAFNQSVINIGSDSGNDIVLMGDTIADFHAMLYFDSDRWFISSLHDNYKTTVNGLVVDASGVPLQNGSVVNIGDYRLTMMLNGMNTDIIIAGSAASYQPSGNEGSAGGNILLSITSAPSTEVEVGTTVEYELTVTNAGPLVANMQLQLQGVPTSWVQIIPPVLNLNEGRKGVFTVRISPPRDSSAKAGFYNLHFVAISPNYQRETGIVDTGLTILPYSDFLLNGPTPRRLTLSRRTQTDSSDVVILNNSNSDSQFFLRSYDDANDLYFSYGRDGQEVQGQDTVTVSAGDNVRVPMRIGSRKLPLLGFTKKTYHYYTNVTPTDRPGDGQSVLGEVVVRPLINTFWLLFALALLLFFALFLLQPRILQFEGADGKQTQVILSGNTAQIQWRVSNLTFIAGKLTLDDGSGEKTVSQTGSQLVSPTKSTTYTLTAENLFSRLLGIPHVRSVQVLIIPQRPVINAFAADHKSALAEQQVKLDWAVGDNAVSASILRNKQQMDLTPETYSGTVTQGYTSDTLFSVRALNDSGYEMKSLFLNVSPARINLNRFTVWVRPNGIAVPNNNDSRRTTRWSALQLNTDSTGPALIRPAVNPQPAPQSITLNIPDNFNNTGSSPQGMNPEQMMLSGQSDGVSGYVYQDPMMGPGSSDLLVSPSLLPTATPTAIPSTELITRQVISSTAVPATSPEAAPYNRDFSVKLVEVVEDPLAESGYRLIDYFPDYQLQKNEQILVEWNVDGVSQVKIENLSNDALNNTGGNFAYPEKSTTYVLEAQTGDLKKDYSLPVRVAGDADEGEGSGLKCDLKANAATLKVPGAVMLSWTGGGTNRVQLVSSSQAEKDSEEAQKKAEQEAKEKGQPYTKPTNAPLTGGTIGDWLQPSGFMRVNVEKQTTFVLNAYDGNGNVICTKSVDVKLEGGNDKKDISDVPGAKFAITRIADDNDVSQAYYTVGQTVHYTIAMTGFPKGQEPTGSVMITDGTSTCSVTLPVTTCAFQAKKAGNLTITAVYSGDNVYSKATATAKETVIDKLPTTLEIQSAYKSAASLAELVSELKFDTKNAYGLIPTGTITFTIGSGTCDLDVITEKLSCEGTVTTDPDNGYKFTLSKMLLADANADRVTATYKGDDYFLPSTAKPVLFLKIPTTTQITDADLPSQSHADIDTLLSWTTTPPDGLIPTGTITLTVIRPDPNHKETKCVLTLGKEPTLSCDGSVTQPVDPTPQSLKYAVEEMLFEDPASDRVKAEYSGDFLFNKSESKVVLFGSIIEVDVPTELNINSASKHSDGKVDMEFTFTWDETLSKGQKPTGALSITSGSGTCSVNINSTTPKLDGCKGSVSLSGNTYTITNLEISGVGDSIKVSYPGEGHFLKSESNSVDFTRVNTQTVIDKAYRLNDRFATVETTLTWKPSESGGDVPSNTVTFKIGNESCVLTFSNDSSDNAKVSIDAFSCEGEDTQITTTGTDKTSGKIVLRIEKMMLSDGNNANSVKATYSGDSKFNASSSKEVMFKTLDTELIIKSATKSPANLVSMEMDLGWFEAAPDNRTPTGIINLTTGSKVCTLDVTGTARLTNCGGTVNCTVADKKYICSIKDMAVTGQSGTNIKAEYAGDGLFLKSSSDTVDFSRLNTTLKINKAYKPDGDLLATVLADLTWTESEAAGKKPTGTLTFTIGADSCAYDITGKKFTSCNGVSTNTAVDETTGGSYKGTFDKILLSANTADRVKVQYSGDSVFNPSSSETVLFAKVNTNLKINEKEDPRSPYKYDESYANVDATLSWKDDQNWIALGCNVEGANCPKPTGTIKYTIRGNSPSQAGDVVTGTCTLDIAKETLNCESVNTTVTRKLDTMDFSVLAMLLADKAADRVKIEYSGDSFYNSSESTVVLFSSDDKSDTTIVIDSAEKMDNAITLTTILTPAGEKTGTITFTSGSATCTLNINDHSDLKFEKCSGTAIFDTADPTKILITDMVMNGTPGDSIYAEYSGDANYNKSTSEAFNFESVVKEDTTISIEPASKTDNAVTMSVKLEPEGTETGTIVFTSGSATCTINITDHTNVKFEKCSGSARFDTDDKTKIIITDMVMSAAPGETIYAEYSGDANYNKSTSSSYSFVKTDTKLSVDKAYKSGGMRADFESLLKWDPSEAGTTKPTGTITYAIGSDSCKLTLDPIGDSETDPKQQTNFTCSDKTTKVMLSQDTTTGKYTLTFTDVLLTAGNTADRVKAEYSGDANFNPSTSEFVLFHSIPTAVEITKLNTISKDSKKLNVYMNLSWTEDPEESEKVPTGTIKFTIGKAVCTLDISGVAPAMSGCIAETIDVTRNGRVQSYVFNGLDAGDLTENIVNAEYSGDGVFASSKFELKTETEILLSFAVLEPNGTVDVNITQKWDQDITGVVKLYNYNYYDMAPSGTIKLTVGSSTCTLQLARADNLKFIDCDTIQASLGHVKLDEFWYTRITIVGLQIGDGSGQSIKAEYSGDELFLKSESSEIFFNHVDTQLTIDKNKTYKTTDNRVNLETTLSWCSDGCVGDSPDFENPTGPVTFMIGSDSCKLELANGSFSCKDGSTVVTIFDEYGKPAVTSRVDGGKTYKDWTLNITGVLLSNGNDADRMKVEFAGDKHFNPSSSDYLLFDTVPTTTDLSEQKKTPEGLVSALVKLSWTKDPLAQDTPKGTIKLTSGSATCTLNLAVDPARFTDCGNNQPVVTKDVSERYWSIQITKLNMGSGAGEDIIAEYSGSGSFLPSSSIKKSFTRVDTTLEIESAFKPNDPNYANLISVLSWNKENAATREPTGTIKYTVGSGSCELNLSTKKLSCRSETDPTVKTIEIGTEKLGYRMTILKMLLADSSADRVTVEYSGDAVFNPSSAAAMLFKKVDTTIDIYKAYRDKTTGRASVYTWMYWDEDEDEGLKPTGTLKYTLGSGSCTMDISTQKVSCVGDLYGMISDDGHDYVVTNLLLTDTDAKIVSVEYSGDGLFNSSVSQQTLINELQTYVAVSSASEGCDGENHCFINLSGTLDWDVDESVTSLPSGTLTIKLGEKSIKFDLNAGTLRGVKESENAYANKVVRYDVNDRHSFEFKNLLLDDVADITEIEVEYNGDDNYAYSSDKKEIDSIKIGTIITLGSPSYGGTDESVWTFNGTLRPVTENLPIDFRPSGSFTMKGTLIIGNTTYEFTPDPITPDGYYKSSNYMFEIKWTDISKGEFELKLYYYHDVVGLSGLNMTSIVYNGDAEGKASKLYNASNTANYYYSEGIKDMKITVNKLYLDPSGRKHVDFSYAGYENASLRTYEGTYTLVTDSASCTIIRDEYSITNKGTCKGDMKSYSPYGTSRGTLVIRNLQLGSISDTHLRVIFEGNQYYNQSLSDKKSIDNVDTNLTIDSQKTAIKNKLLEVYATLTLVQGHPFIRDLTLPSPSGELVVEAGDNYTCTMDLELQNHSTNYKHYVVKPHEDCGSDEVSSYEEPFWFDGNNKILHIGNIPVPDSEVSEVKVIYNGDTIYNGSEKTIEFSDKAATNLTLERVSNDSNQIKTIIRSDSTVGIPTGDVTFYFSPSLTSCTLTVTDSGVTVKDDCPDGTSVDIPALSAGNVNFILNKQNTDDYYVWAYFSGDSQYASSEGSASLLKYRLTLTPDTQVLGSEGGRYYFNTKEEGRYYPKFPEQHISNASQYCDSNYTSSECRLLKRKFNLSVRIDTDPYAPDIPTGSKLQFSGDFSSDSSSNQCTITPDSSSGVYHCKLENVYFNTPGLKKISVSFSESDSFYSASADFPEMYAVSIGFDSKESRTAINSPASSVVINVGDTVTIVADAFEYQNPGNNDTEPTHYMIYAYDSVTNHSYDQSCNSNNCTLTIPSGANSIIAEYLGNDELRPSLASKSVGDSSTSSGNMTSLTNSMPRGLGVSITIENIQPITEGE